MEGAEWLVRHSGSQPGIVGTLTALPTRVLPVEKSSSSYKVTADVRAYSLMGP